MMKWLMGVLMVVFMVSGYQVIAIEAKATLAQFLIEQAWDKTLQTQGQHKPWSWADTWPVARLKVPALHINLIVLEGMKGNSLAFAPGHATASASFSGKGIKIIAGHRDTHFHFLKDIKKGMKVMIQNNRGTWKQYRITSSRIVNIHNGPMNYQPQQDQLRLITCYPFDAINPGGPLRFVVSAEQVTAVSHNVR